MKDILTERSDGILRVELNRPEKRNALTSNMYMTLADIFGDAAKDEDIRVVLWYAAGESFCAGNDVEDFLKNPPGAGDSPQARLMDALLDFGKPLVAAVQGAAIGGGTTMLTHCDFVYAAESARFQMPFVNLAVVPEFGSSCSVPESIGHIRAAELLLLGLPFDARRAAALGLVTRVLPDRDLQATAAETARALAAKPASALQASKRLMKQPFRERIKTAMRAENEAFSVQVRSDDAKEAFAAFLEKRSPSFNKTKRVAAVDVVPAETETDMTDAEVKSKRQSGGRAADARLFLLEVSGGQVFSMNPDGSDKKVIASKCRIPDGVTVDVEAGHVYWTNMGVPHLNDGSIERADLDGKNRKFIVPSGGTHTPKQLHLDKAHSKLYWCDREGMRVMRANLDGSKIETLVETGRSDEDRRDQTRWCVGITIDPKLQKIYWTQKGPDNAGLGRILRANIEIPKGESPTNRSDIEVLFDRLPEPIDLELDVTNRVLYWTDRGDPPNGNTVNRAPVDKKSVPEILITHLMEGIGIALDVPGNRMFVTDLAGSVYCADLDGKNERNFLFAQGNLTGIAYAEAQQN